MLPRIARALLPSGPLSNVYAGRCRREGDIDLFEVAAARLRIFRDQGEAMLDESRLKLTLDLTEEMLATLDAWRQSQPEFSDREAAALRLLKMSLEEAAVTAAQTPAKP